ncbi:MAG: DUF4406 domain-containing protein [Prevotella sp.]
MQTLKEGKKKAYISGKVTGLTREEVLANFKQGEKVAKDLGYIPVVPIYYITEDETWEGAMKIAIKLQMGCDVVLHLNNWEDSKGAVIEHQVAQMVNMPILLINYPVASMNNAFLS